MKKHCQCNDMVGISYASTLGILFITSMPEVFAMSGWLKVLWKLKWIKSARTFRQNWILLISLCIEQNAMVLEFIEINFSRFMTMYYSSILGYFNNFYKYG